VPRMSLEALVKLDPPSVIVLAADTIAQDELLKPWYALTSLSAVRTGQVGAVRAPDVFSTGPGILGLVARLRDELHRLGLVARRSGTVSGR